MHHRRHGYLRNLVVKKPKLFLSIIIILFLLALLLSVVFKRDFDRQKQIMDRNSNLHSGSAVRKETTLREKYERTYRTKDKDWDKKYGKILENKEEVTLKEIDKKLKKKTLD